MGKAPSRVLAVTVLLGVVLALSACTPDSGYVSSTSQGMYFKIPTAWHTYSQTNLKRDGLISTTVPYVIAFDADPRPDPNHLLASSTYPWGLAEVDGISASGQLTFSLDSLLNAVIPVDQLQSGSSGSVSPLSPTRVITRGSLHGLEAALRVVVSGHAPVSFEQISLVNAATTKTWLLIIGCSAACFAHHRRDIDRVVTSLIVNARPV